ncbi:MAG TPA: DnaA N-terminal domain-containing protein, partial [Cellvibrio sp.]
MLQSVWKLCAASLQDELPSQQFNTWIKPLQIDEAANPNELRLLAPNRFISNWVEEKFLTRIKELVGHYHEHGSLSVVVAVGAKAAFQASNPSFASNTSFNNNSFNGVARPAVHEPATPVVARPVAAPVVRETVEVEAQPSAAERSYRPLEESR